jgi:hypothetical protein
MIKYGNSDDILTETKISWFQYFNVRCGLGREGKFFNCILYIIFIIIGFFMCNISVIIFNLHPQLFDLLAPDQIIVDADDPLPIFGAMSFIISVIAIALMELPCILFCNYGVPDNYMENRRYTAKWSLIIYMFTVITSNILAIIVLKQPIHKFSLILAIPLISFATVTIIISFLIGIFTCFDCILNCFIEDKQKLENMMMTKKM